jgi:hypothetical protein
VVRRCFELAAQRLTDCQVASQVGLRLTHLHEILTNPFYLDQLRDGSPASVSAAIPTELWNQVQLIRGQFARGRASPRERPGAA